MPQPSDQFEPSRGPDFDPARPYGSSWETWRAKGWAPLILPVGKKASPPKGFTGIDAVDASYADCYAWAEERPGGNIGIRMPRGVVGIDVDAYTKGDKVKTGDRTIRRWEQEAGATFPPTWRITSRGVDNPSGKYLYRVPDGVRLINGRDDVDVLQRHHRYAVAAPSCNDDDGGNVVRVYGPDGTEVTDPADLPTPADLPELPAALVEYLRESAEMQHVRKLDRDELNAFMASLPGGEPCTAMRNKTAAALEACRGGSRHDDVLKAVGGLLRVSEMGHPGVRTAIAELERVFVAEVVGSRRGGSEEATGEFRRMVKGDRIAALITSNPTKDKGCKCGTGFGVAEVADMLRNAFEMSEEGAEDIVTTILEVAGDEKFDEAFEQVTGRTVRPAEPEPAPAPGALRIVRDTPAPAGQKPAAKTEKREAFDFRRFDNTEAGNGQRFVAFYGRSKIVYVPGANLLRSWTGSVWRTDDGAMLRHLMEEMTLAMLAQARMDAAAADKLEEEAAVVLKTAKDAADKDAEEQAKIAAAAVVARNRGVREFAKWCVSSRKGSALDQASKSARSNPALRVDEGEWDADPRRLNVANGTLVIDYSGGVELRPHDPDDLITQRADVTYDPDAVSPRFDRFLTEAVPHPAVRRVLRALAGLTLLGDNERHLFPILIGPKRSGKTTLLEVLGYILGNEKVSSLSYTSPYDLNILRPKRGGGGNPELVRLLNRRFCWTVEADDGMPLSADMIKRFSGGDRLSARDNYARKDGIQDRAPAFMAWLGTNKVPQIDGADSALFERVVAVPFPHTRPADKRESGLAKRIARTEGSGVLNWALAGLRDVLANPQILTDLPEVCVELSKQMYGETNPVQRWITERCEPCPCEDDSECMTHADAWTSFTKMMDHEREAKISNNLFGRALKDADHPAVPVRRTVNGESKTVKIRRGLRFTAEELARQQEEAAHHGLMRQMANGGGISIGGRDD